MSLPNLNWFFFFKPLSMGDKILQWNVRGFQANREDLLFLTRFCQLSVLALQETLQSDCTKLSLSGYTVLHKSSGLDSTSGANVIIHF